MKFTDMIHSTVVAFEPAKRPGASLIALAMMLIALVLIAYFCGSGAASIFTALT